MYKKMLTISQQLDTEINTIKKTLATLPEGTLYCIKNGAYYKWYHQIKNIKKIITKDQKHFAEQLAIKKYYSLKLKTLQQEKKAIDAYLKLHATQEDPAEQLLTDNSNYKELLMPYFTSFSQKIIDWINFPYEHNPKNPDSLIHKTVNGLFVRSKSEAIIAKLLYTNKIPFRYECALTLGTRTVYPDFTIFNPKTGELIYWEHFGMMDNPEYAQHACAKLSSYVSNGLIPSIHLIVTYETKEPPLSIEEVEDIIKIYFL